MKNLTLVERINDGSQITIKYSFGDIIAKDLSKGINASIYFKKADNKYSDKIMDYYISDYNKLRLMSGIEEFAKEALLEYHKTMSQHAEFCKP